ncbi:MAG: tetratricopeptide repeat protein [Bacteroidia bacterium]|nr:tetratricopeptide repeat protein [Bacteroidia bacterium]
MKKNVIALILMLSAIFSVAQRLKLQTAWRAMNDYELTLKDNKPDVSYLHKAKEAIDAAMAHEDTKNQGKTYAYKTRILYYLYNYELMQEAKRLEATVPDKNERMSLAYGNTPTTYFEEANKTLEQLKDIDPKYMETIQEGFKGAAHLTEEDIKFLTVAGQLKVEAANIANGKYKAKKFDEAADYFYKTANLNTLLTKKKDTANYYNACISAAKAKDNNRIIEYNKKMIDGKIAEPYNFISIYNAFINKADTFNALNYLKRGRTAFPNSTELLNTEANHFLQTGNSAKAIEILKAGLEKNPNSFEYNLALGNLYDRMANPKNSDGKDADKPSNFEELVKTSEGYYLKAIEVGHKDTKQLSNAYYNLGALYNNVGGYYQQQASAVPIKDAKTKGKELENKSNEYFKKAIPYLEKSLEFEPNDRSTMVALRKLYIITGDNQKATQMSERLKKQ